MYKKLLFVLVLVMPLFGHQYIIITDGPSTAYITTLDCLTGIDLSVLEREDIQFSRCFALKTLEDAVRIAFLMKCGSEDKKAQLKAIGKADTFAQSIKQRAITAHNHYFHTEYPDRTNTHNKDQLKAYLDII